MEGKVTEAFMLEKPATDGKGRVYSGVVICATDGQGHALPAIDVALIPPRERERRYLVDDYRACAEFMSAMQAQLPAALFNVSFFAIVTVFGEDSVCRLVLSLRSGHPVLEISRATKPDLDQFMRRLPADALAAALVQLARTRPR